MIFDELRLGVCEGKTENFEIIFKASSCASYTFWPGDLQSDSRDEEDKWKHEMYVLVCFPPPQG
jgi:hypothetical protein